MQAHATSEKSGSTSFVNRKKKQPFFAPAFVQPKLSIGPVDDPYEREADAMADKVMRMSDTETLQTKPSPINIQRKCEHCEEEEKLQRKESGEEDEQMVQMRPIMDLSVQRKCEHCEEEEKLQRKEDDEEDESMLQLKPIMDLPVQRKCAACEEGNIQKKESATSSTPAVSPSVHQALQSSSQPMDRSTRTFMESRFGYDFGNVQIHNDPLAHRSSKEINALAYTHGQHIVFAGGQYQPNTNSGKQLLAHELTHVVQQGRVVDSIQRKASENSNVNENVADNNSSTVSSQELSSIQPSIQNQNNNVSGAADATDSDDTKTKTINIGEPSTVARTANINNGESTNTKENNADKTFTKPFGELSVSLAPKIVIRNDDLFIPEKATSDKEKYTAFNLATRKIKAETIELTDFLSKSIDSSRISTLKTITTYANNKFNSIQQYFTSQKEQLMQEKLFKKNGLEKEKTENKNRLYENYKTNYNNIFKNYTARKEELNDIGSSKSEEIMNYGEEKAVTMEKTTKANVAEAFAIGKDVAKKYEHGHNGEDIWNMAMDAAYETVIKIKEEGAETAAAIRKDGADLSAKINNAVTKTEKGLDDLHVKTQATLLDTFNESNEKIDYIIDESQNKIDEVYDSAIDKIPAIKEATLNSARAIYARFIELFSALHIKFQQDVRKAGASEVSNIQSTSQQYLSQASSSNISGTRLQEYFKKATAELQGTNTRFQTGFESGTSILTGTSSTLTSSLMEGMEQLASTAALQINMIRAACLSSVDKMITESTTQISQIDEKSNESFGKEALYFDTNSSDLIEKNRTQVEQMVVQAKTSIDEKLAKETNVQAEQVKELSERVNDKAEDLSDDSILSGIVGLVSGFISAIAGFVWGVFKGIVKLIIGLVILIAGIVVAIALIVAAVVVIFALLVFVLGAEIALLVAVIVGIVLVCVAALIVLVIVALGIIGSIISIFKNLFTAFTDYRMSVFDREALVGESVFDIYLLLLPFKGKAKAPSLEGDAADALLGDGKKPALQGQNQGLLEAPKTESQPADPSLTDSSQVENQSSIDSSNPVDSSSLSDTTGTENSSSITDDTVISDNQKISSDPTDISQDSSQTESSLPDPETKPIEPKAQENQSPQSDSKAPAEPDPTADEANADSEANENDPDAAKDKFTELRDAAKKRYIDAKNNTTLRRAELDNLRSLKEADRKPGWRQEVEERQEALDDAKRAEDNAKNDYDRAEKAFRDSRKSLSELLREKAEKQKVYTDVRDRANGIDEVSGKRSSNIHVDHLVAIARIVLKRGFDRLNPEVQLRIINMVENLEALDGSANSSKGDYKWSEWPNARKFYTQEQINERILEEQKVEQAIDDAIAEALKSSVGSDGQ